MTYHNRLYIGDVSENGQVTIVDEDRLCYQVKSVSHGATGIRTISKALLQEFISYMEQHPEVPSNEVRFKISGQSEIDKYEYGYGATIGTMAKMVLGQEGIVNSLNKGEQIPLQQIFYGAPGTGKSHKIKEDANVKAADEKNLVFRTTFHPDSDYSTFVGCYKPTKVNTRKQQRLNLSLEDLAKELSGYYANEELGKIAGIQKFCFEYHPYIDGEYMSVNVSKLLELAGIPKDYNVEINKYVKFCHLIPKQDPDKITYEFVPQAFMQSYVAAWNNPDENVFLVIEEINRGNCAQIFGDLFQLLDRNRNGFSEYPIKADNDMAKYLIEGKDENGNDVLTNKDGIKDGKLVLPSNLYIWATMNTSDQSLFPIDSAFKRRWDWVYMPIDTKKENWHIQIGDSRYSWTAFLDKVNDELLTDETAEDKHLGFYFCKAENGIISKETFVAKVLFYLWTDVFKVYGIPSVIGSGKEWSFAKFYNPDGSVNEAKVKELMAKLQIEVVASTSTEDETTEIESN